MSPCMWWSGEEMHMLDLPCDCCFLPKLYFGLVSDLGWYIHILTTYVPANELQELAFLLMRLCSFVLTTAEKFLSFPRWGH